MKQDNEEPPSMSTSPDEHGDENIHNTSHPTTTKHKKNSIQSFLRRLFRIKPDTTLRETIEDYIEEDHPTEEEPSISEHEKDLISNILNLRNLSASDVMVPRADIIAINEDTTQEELLSLLVEHQYSRIPVYRDTLDHVIGSIHIKDILSSLAQNKSIAIKDLVREVPIVSPAMTVPDLLLQMRITRKHMTLVVDEFGGIDGLITINDVIESIIGEIDDEHDTDEQPTINPQEDGSLHADARYDLESFEEQFGSILNDEERQENDTLGGLIFFLAGRVPARGEVLSHQSGMVFEILDADPRRVNKLCIRNIPEKTT
ncbi:MAG: hemolysin family protein [Alphaproteobacteria bacterium]